MSGRMKKNAYQAMSAFAAAQDFDGLLKLRDWFTKKWQDSFDLINTLNILEDHEGIHNLLNINFDASFGTTSFASLNEPVIKYRDNFLKENGTPVATGVINEGIDLVAIRNLSQRYDIAIPIARGGLNQGAIAKLWGMPTRIVDIAAHNRKTPKGKWVNPVSEKDFEGKRVLFFDKDAVTGATINQALKMLSRFNPSSVGIYFAHNLTKSGDIGTHVENLPNGLEIFYPGNSPLQNAGDAYMEAHEKLGTLYGKRLKAEHLFAEEIKNLKEKDFKLSETLKTFISKQVRAFDSLNHFLPGASNVRERILSTINAAYRDHRINLDSNLYDLPRVKENFKLRLSTTPPLPFEFESLLIRARYERVAEDAAKRRSIENFHQPNDPLAAFDAAYRAVKDGFDVALIVGPEGFAYEPYFQDLGLRTMAVNIPESEEGEPRSIKLYDDLASLKDKKVLIVEDDVRTGATLQKLLEHIKPNTPKHIGLYLGQSETFQKMMNIPKELIKTYIAEPKINSTTGATHFREFLESKNLKIFKTSEAVE